MKKLFVMLIAGTLMLNVSACGSSEKEPETTAPVIQEQSAAEETVEEAVVETEEETVVEVVEEAVVKTEEETVVEVVEETVAEIEEETIEETESMVVVEAEKTTTASFDTGWAGAAYVMPIPEPPFAYEVDGNSGGVKISSTNGGEGGDVTHDKILSYCQMLKDAGYTESISENVIGTRYGRTCYAFNAKNKEGKSVELLDDGGGVVIFVYF